MNDAECIRDAVDAAFFNTMWTGIIVFVTGIMLITLIVLVWEFIKTGREIINVIRDDTRGGRVMAERMVEVIGYKDPIGGGLYNMGVTDERIVRCRDCRYYADHEWVIATDVSDVCHFWADGVKVEPNGFCKWALPRSQGVNDEH